MYGNAKRIILYFTRKLKIIEIIAKLRLIKLTLLLNNKFDEK
jgi:hypothetical protein